MDEIPSPAGQPPRGEHRRQGTGLAGLLLSSACRWGQDLLRVPVFVIFLLVELPKVSGLSFRLAMSHFSLRGWRICSVPHLCFLAPRPFPLWGAVLPAPGHSLLPAPSCAVVSEVLGSAEGAAAVWMPCGNVCKSDRELSASLVPVSSLKHRGPCAKFLALLLLLVFPAFFSVDVH